MDAQAPPGGLERHARWLVLLAWVVAAIAWRFQLGVRWLALSVDDVFRTEHVLQAAAGDLFPSDLWPPLPFWLAGALVRLGVPAWTAPGLTNFAATILALALVADTARVLVPRGAAAAVALAGTLPWTLWLGWSGLGEPVAAAAHAAVLRGLVDWRGRSGTALVVAGLCLGGLTRYEAWGDVAVVTCLAFAVRREVPWRWALLPLAFPITWLCMQALWFGDPLNFATSAREALAPDVAVGTPALRRALSQLWEAADIVLVAGAIGWWRIRSSPRARAPFLFGLATLVAQIVAGTLDYAGAHTGPRHFLAHVPFLAVGAGALVAEAGPIGSIVVMVTVLALRLGVSAYADPPQYVDPALQDAVARMAPLLAEGPGKLLVELDDFPSLAVPILLGEPRVAWDREPARGGDPRAQPSIFTRSRPAVLAWMEQEDVGFVLTVTAKGRARAGTVAERAFEEEPYAGFVLR